MQYDYSICDWRGGYYGLHWLSHELGASHNVIPHDATLLHTQHLLHRQNHQKSTTIQPTETHSLRIMSQQHRVQNHPFHLKQYTVFEQIKRKIEENKIIEINDIVS